MNVLLFAGLRSSVADPNGHECSDSSFGSEIEVAIKIVVFGSAAGDPSVSLGLLRAHRCRACFSPVLHARRERHRPSQTERQQK